MPHKSQKGFDFCVSLRWSEFSHGLQILSTGLNAFLGDIMRQIVNLTLEELTPCQLELQVVLSEVLEHNMQTM